MTVRSCRLLLLTLAWVTTSIGCGDDGTPGPTDAGGSDAATLPDAGTPDTGTMDAGEADAFVPEICDDGDDDDADGDVDCADADCAGTDACVAVSIATGIDHACAVTASGQVVCWGTTADGRLGDGRTRDAPSLPVRVEGIEDAVQVSVGHEFSCVLHADGAVSCWGDNDVGQVGDGSTVSTAHPTSVDLPSPAVQIAAGGRHACARVEEEGGIWCWGDNSRGQLGDTTPGTHSTEPVRTQIVVIFATGDLRNATDVSCGDLHCCARNDANLAACWGDNQYGQLGVSTDSFESASAAVPIQDEGGEFLDVESVAVGAIHSCARTVEGRIYCWGDNSNAQLDGATTQAGSDRALEVASVGTVPAVFGGGDHACVLRDSGRAACWGANEQLELGASTPGPVASPMELAEPGGLASVAPGRDFLCLRTEGGEVHCLGGNANGELGVETSADRTAVPQRVRF